MQKAQNTDLVVCLGGKAATGWDQKCIGADLTMSVSSHAGENTLPNSSGRMWKML